MAALRWIRDFEACVRGLDYAAARRLFAEDVLAFGTHAAVVGCRDALERQQWMVVWPRIRNFAFRTADLRCVGNETGLCVIVPWDSLGLAADGPPIPRPGRATLVLVPRDGIWVGVHSHFSLAPIPESNGAKSKGA
jgi:ketosteroid isomerase-like protein